VVDGLYQAGKVESIAKLSERERSIPRTTKRERLARNAGPREPRGPDGLALTNIREAT
jgi:hypothetical protein